jgi:hypothetical protein
LEKGGEYGDEHYLVLPKDTELRIYAFKSFVTSESWPRAKVKVYPNGHRMGEFYIYMEQLENLSWY